MPVIKKSQPSRFSKTEMTFRSYVKFSKMIFATIDGFQDCHFDRLKKVNGEGMGGCKIESTRRKKSQASPSQA